jgi:hypothetical protein
MAPALDCTVLIPIRQSTSLIRKGSLEWLAACPNPVTFVVESRDIETRTALDGWLATNNINATLVVQQRPGLSGALNDALDAINTEYVHWCGAHDQAYWWQHSRVVARIGLQRPAWIVGRCDTSRSDGRATAAGLYRQLLHRATPWLLPLTNTVGCPAIIFSRQAALTVGGFDEATQAAMDYDLWVRLHGLRQLVVVPFSLGRFTVHDDSLTRGHRRSTLDDCYRVRRRYFRHALMPTLARALQAAQFKVQDLLRE